MALKTKPKPAAIKAAKLAQSINCFSLSVNPIPKLLASQTRCRRRYGFVAEKSINKNRL